MMTVLLINFSEEDFGGDLIQPHHLKISLRKVSVTGLEDHTWIPSTLCFSNLPFIISFISLHFLLHAFNVTTILGSGC